MAHLEGIAHWLKYEFDVDVLLTTDLAFVLDTLRHAERDALGSSSGEEEERSLCVTETGGRGDVRYPYPIRSIAQPKLA